LLPNIVGRQGRVSFRKATLFFEQPNRFSRAKNTLNC
jgi:hypothetical protein